MKKIWIIILLIAMALSTQACGGSASGSSDPRDIIVGDLPLSDNVLQDAVDLLPVNGGRVVIDTPTLTMYYGLIIDKDNVTLEGNGATLDLSIGAPTIVFKDSSISGPGILVSGHNVTLRGFQLRGVSGNTGDGVTVEGAMFAAKDLTVDHMAGDALRIGGDQDQNCNYARLDRLLLVANQGYGLFIWSGSRNANNGVGTQIITKDNVAGNIAMGNAVNWEFDNANASGSTSGTGIRLLSGARGNVFMCGNVERNNNTYQIIINSGAEGNVMHYQRVSRSEILNNGDHNSIVVGLDVN